MNARAQETRDDELHRIQAEFALAYAQGESLVEWIDKYPAYALDLADVALTIDEPDMEPATQEALVAATDALTRSRNQVFGTPPTPISPGLSARASSLGYTVPQLAREFHLGGDILFKLDHGMIRLETVPRRLFRQLSAALQWTHDFMPAQLVGARTAPAFYAADAPPQSEAAQSFAEALAASDGMSNDDRLAWLGILREEGLLQ